MSETSTAAAPPPIRTRSSRNIRQLLSIAQIAVLIWVVQTIPLLVLGQGFGVAGVPFFMGSFILTMAWTVAFDRVLASDAGRIRPVFGGGLGVGLAFVHWVNLLGLMPGVSPGSALPGSLSGSLMVDGVRLASWAALFLGGAMAACVGAGLCWAGGLLVDPRGTVLGLVTGFFGAWAVHALLLSSLGVGGGGWDYVTSCLFCMSLGLLLGARLGDLQLLQSPSSVKLKERFRSIAQSLPIPIIVTGADHHRVVFANERSRQQLKIDDITQNALPQSMTDMFYIDPGEQARLIDQIRRDGSVENYEVHLRRSDDSSFWALVAARSIIFDGEPSIVAAYYDITDRKLAEQELLESEVRYALISRASNDGIWDWDIPSGRVYYSARWRQIVGEESGRRLSTLDDWLSRIHPDDVGRVKREIDEHIAGHIAQLDTEYRLRHGDGRFCWMHCRAIVLRSNGGEPIRMAGSQSDITLRKTYEINLLNAAYEDRLTGINNRAFFTHLVDTRNDAEAIAGTAVVLFNIDQFSRVNESLGSGAGDALLVAIARRLAGRVTAQDALSRLGGDEFAVWLQNVPDHQAALDWAELVQTDLRLPYCLGDVELPVTVSIGIAAPTLGDAPGGTDLLRNARLALDRAKGLGGGRAELFNDALLRETNLRRRLSKDLTNAERLGQIFFHYQPLVVLSGENENEISGFEVLMRWRHPDLGLISPVQFIPLAEEAGLIGPLGSFAIESAAREFTRWDEAGLVGPRFSIAVNLSARQISDQSGVTRLLALLDRLGLPPGRLKLELTESVLMNDPEAMAKTLQALRDRGVELSLDDFGTGYSSLSYLHRFPLDVLKIDRSFISRMGSAPEAFRLVRSIIELAHDLGLKVVAEGVETRQDAAQLRELGCDYGQGYLFSRPVPADEAQHLLKRRML